jgi:hypothetical protein
MSDSEANYSSNDRCMSWDTEYASSYCSGILIHSWFIMLLVSGLRMDLRRVNYR